MAWLAPDDERPLSPRGHRQAEWLASALGVDGVSRLFSSPAVRCRQTLEPTALALGLSLEPIAALAEGRPGAAVLKLIEGLTEVSALCSHGDVIGEVLDLLVQRGLIGEERLHAAKGSIWELSVESGLVVAARYRRPDRA